VGSQVAPTVLVVMVALVLVFLTKGIRIVRQGKAGVVERRGRYSRTLEPGLAILVPYLDRLLLLIDLKEQFVTFPPQPVITEDNEVVCIDIDVYLQVTDPKAATYGVDNYIQGVERLTVTTLRKVVGNLTVVEALTSRDVINAQVRSEVDQATGKWGIGVNRIEIKDIDPPASVKESLMEQTEERLQQMRGVVTQQVDARGGRIELRGGVWSARTYDPSLVIAAGKNVEVVEIVGATAVVYESEL
jgi:regulator of protease activity HflC (stomatin/prohibitin superfamily)